MLEKLKIKAHWSLADTAMVMLILKNRITKKKIMSLLCDLKTSILAKSVTSRSKAIQRLKESTFYDLQNNAFILTGSGFDCTIFCHPFEGYYTIEGVFDLVICRKIMCLVSYKNPSLLLVCNDKYTTTEIVLGICCLKLPILWDMLEDGEL